MHLLHDVVGFNHRDLCDDVACRWAAWTCGPRADGAVNEEWSCDKGRFAFRYLTGDERTTRPLVRGADGELHEASWTDALAAA